MYFFKPSHVIFDLAGAFDAFLVSHSVYFMSYQLKHTSKEVRTVIVQEQLGHGSHNKPSRVIFDLAGAFDVFPVSHDVANVGQTSRVLLGSRVFVVFTVGQANVPDCLKVMSKG